MKPGLVDLKAEVVKRALAWELTAQALDGTDITTNRMKFKNAHHKLRAACRALSARSVPKASRKGKHD